MVLERLKQFLFPTGPGYYRESHRRYGECPLCRIQVDSTMRAWRPTRYVLFYCDYDEPRVAGKPRWSSHNTERQEGAE
jgi:hypothetical protein